jgi:hypothetical protein
VSAILFVYPDLGDGIDRRLVRISFQVLQKPISLDCKNSFPIANIQNTFIFVTNRPISYELSNTNWREYLAISFDDIFILSL